MPTFRHALALIPPIVAACATLPPEGPTVMALPGTGQSFEQFRVDDAQCREYARQTIAPRTPASAAAESGATSAVVGTAIGAAVGAAVDGSSGVAVGAGVGLLAGSVAGVAAGNRSAYDLQQIYDQNYLQCMYARGQRVPVPAGYVLPGAYHDRPPRAAVPPPPPPPAGPPPPPPGSPAPVPRPR